LDAVALPPLSPLLPQATSASAIAAVTDIFAIIFMKGSAPFARSLIAGGQRPGRYADH
jgi:hypothetical protein